MGGSILAWASVFLAGLCLGSSVAILVILWRVWGNTDRAEQHGKERLEILREQQERLAHMREERRILLEELERLREQKERLRWLQEGRAALLAELKRLRSQLEEQRQRVETALPVHTEPQLRLVAGGEQRNRQGRQQALMVDSGYDGSVRQVSRPEEHAQPLEFSGSEPIASSNRLLRFLASFLAMFGERGVN